MARLNRGVAAQFGLSLKRASLTATAGATENIPGGQTIQSVAQSVVGAGAGGVFSLCVLDSTTTTTTEFFGSQTLAVTSNATLGAIEGSVLAVGPTVSPSAGVQPTCEIHWVTEVSGNTLTISPGLFSTWSSGTTVSLLPAIVTDVNTSQGADGTDLGTTVVASVSSVATFPTTQIGGYIYVTALRTYYQYPSWANIPDYVSAPYPGPQNTQIANANPGNPSGGWSSGPVLPIDGSQILVLESGTPWFNTTLSSAEPVGSSVLAITAGPTATIEAMVGDQTEPAELVYGVSTSTSFSMVGAPTTYTVGSGPQGICVDSSGDVYVANTTASTITKITSGGSVTTAWATLTHAPVAICVDTSGTVYTVDGGSTVSKVTPGGTVTNTWATVGSGPQAVCTDASDNVYTANYGTNTVSKVTSSGTVTTSWATVSPHPASICVASSGNLYVGCKTNTATGNVAKITSGGSVTAPWATLPAGAFPWGICVDASENVYTANYTNSSVSFITGGTVTGTYAIAGNAYGICVDSSRNVYATSYTTGVISKVTPGGSVTSGWASTGANPDGICVDSSGIVYTANAGGSSVTTVNGSPEQTQYAHANGAQFESVTSTGVSNWTFIPVLRVGNPSGQTVAFSAPTMTIDPR